MAGRGIKLNSFYESSQSSIAFRRLILRSASVPYVARNRRIDKYTNRRVIRYYIGSGYSQSDVPSLKKHK